MKTQAKSLVLVVDDEADLSAVLALRIGGAGFRVASAVDGEDALEKARFLKPDAIVLDIQMPKLDGWGFCRALRADPALKGTPVIILTAWLADDLKRRAAGAGAADLMVKPYDETALIRRLRELCPEK